MTIPQDVKTRLSALQLVNRRAGGGKEYWSEGLRVMGVDDDGTVMRFRHSTVGKDNADPTAAEGQGQGEGIGATNHPTTTTTTPPTFNTIAAATATTIVPGRLTMAMNSVPSLGASGGSHSISIVGATKPTGVK